MRCLPFVTALALAVLATPAFAGLAREKGATYIEGFFPSPIRLTLAKSAPIFSTLAGKRSLGTLAAGQKLEVVAVSDRALRVRGTDQGRGVSGWIGRGFVAEPRPNFFADLTRAGARAEAVADLVNARVPATGMTANELYAALGRPHEHTTSIANGITQDTVHYVRTRRVPRSIIRRDAYGHLFESIVYVTTEIDRTTIVLDNGIVTLIQASGSNGFGLRRAPQSVPPPIDL